jgi:Ca-activated chloride channel family protein
VGPVALARPAVRALVPKDRATIVLVLDVSGSMGANDMFPSRLAAAKRASKSFVDALPPGFRIGVVSFSSAASLVQPITEDYRAVRSAIDELQTGGGTAIGEGIQVALAALPSDVLLAPAPPVPVPGQPPPPPPAVILLLTDGQNGEGVEPMVAADKARAANVPVFTIGMGSRGGGFGPGARGGGIDEELLNEVAAFTGGQYYYAPNGGELRRVYTDLGVALGWDFSRREIGHFFAGGGLALAALGFGLGALWLHRQP